MAARGWDGSVPFAPVHFKVWFLQGHLLPSGWALIHFHAADSQEQLEVLPGLDFMGPRRTGT